jgi:hypothetical protein
LFDVAWLAVLTLIGIVILTSVGKNEFMSLTRTFPILMGFIKFFVLATMGELLARRIVSGSWRITGIFLLERAFVWGMLGVLFAFVFPIYSAGVDSLISLHFLPNIFPAFWKSFFINILFAFPMMTFHRITDTLIDRRKLFRKWPFLDVWKSIDWDNMWKMVAPTVIWFWIPAHTITFSLLPEFRIIMAAGLSICLGVILAFAKQRAKRV